MEKKLRWAVKPRVSLKRLPINIWEAPGQKTNPWQRHNNLFSDDLRATTSRTSRHSQVAEKLIVSQKTSSRELPPTTDASRPLTYPLPNRSSIHSFDTNRRRVPLSDVRSPGSIASVDFASDSPFARLLKPAPSSSNLPAILVWRRALTRSCTRKPHSNPNESRKSSHSRSYDCAPPLPAVKQARHYRQGRRTRSAARPLGMAIGPDAQRTVGNRRRWPARRPGAATQPKPRRHEVDRAQQNQSPQEPAAGVAHRDFAAAMQKQILRRRQRDNRPQRQHDEIPRHMLRPLRDRTRATTGQKLSVMAASRSGAITLGSNKPQLRPPIRRPTRRPAQRAVHHHAPTSVVCPIAARWLSKTANRNHQRSTSGRTSIASAGKVTAIGITVTPMLIAERQHSRNVCKSLPDRDDAYYRLHAASECRS